MPIEAATPIEETVLRFKGKAKRTTLGRSSYAECLDPDCDSAWVGVSSIGASGKHALGSGHPVIQHYEASYRIDPVIDATEPIVTNKTAVARGQKAIRKLRSNVTSND